MPFAAAFAVTLLAMTTLWLVSLWRRDASIVDIYWGPGFTLIAVVAGALGRGVPARRALVITLTALWGLRLGGYLLWRSWGRGEDFRYRAMRRRFGERFPLVSLGLVFGL